MKTIDPLLEVPVTQISSESKKEVVPVASNLFFLDALRGAAALIVMIGHARWLLWEGYSEGFLKHPGSYSFIEKVFVYFLSLFRYGHQAVLFFFVLSGFVIHLKYSKSLQKNGDTKFDFGNYLYRRFKRIYPPFLFALLITFLLDQWGSHLGYSIYKGQTPNTLLNDNISLDFSWRNLFGNLFFWQGPHVGQWGTNGPLWSLRYEWWFYMIYPILFWVNRKSAIRCSLAVLGVFIVTFAIHPPIEILFLKLVLQYLLFWWFGALLADIYTRRIRLAYGYLAWLVILLPVMAIEGEKVVTNTLISDGLWALSFFGLLNLFFFLQQKGFGFGYLKKWKWLGDCSYTLYIIHFPILVFCNGLILHATGNVMPKSLLFVFLGIPVIVFTSYVIHFIIEKPFISVRR